MSRLSQEFSHCIVIQCSTCFAIAKLDDGESPRCSVGIETRADNFHPGGLVMNMSAFPNLDSSQLFFEKIPRRFGSAAIWTDLR